MHASNGQSQRTHFCPSFTVFSVVFTRMNQLLKVSPSLGLRRSFSSSSPNVTQIAPSQFWVMHLLISYQCLSLLFLLCTPFLGHDTHCHSLHPTDHSQTITPSHISPPGPVFSSLVLPRYITGTLSSACPKYSSFSPFC
jgi:hypothetical protein